MTPSPATTPAQLSAAEAAEKEVVFGILERQRMGQTLSPREISRLGRYEQRRAERLLDQAFELGITQKKLCEYFTVPRKTVLEWEAKGMPRNQDKAYPLRRCLVWWKGYMIAQAKEPSDKESPALERKRLADAKLAELRLKRETRVVVSRTEAEDDRRTIVQVFVNALERLDTDFAGAFPSRDVVEYTEWLARWQVAERERMIEPQGTAKG